MIIPCTQCGRDWIEQDELLDTVYPSQRDPYTGEFTEWNVVCQLHNTGCGRTVYGKSKTETVERWNQGETDEMLPW
jgi:hypothetical protein